MAPCKEPQAARATPSTNLRFILKKIKVILYHILLKNNGLLNTSQYYRKCGFSKWFTYEIHFGNS